MAPIIADNTIESGCEFVDNSNNDSTTIIVSTTNNSTTADIINNFSESNALESNEEDVCESFVENVVASSGAASECLSVESNQFESDENGLYLPNDKKQQQQEQQQQHEQMPWEAPGKQGLYDPQNEHEACGVGFIVAIDGKRSHKVSEQIYRKVH